MIRVLLLGRTGNNLFQYAFGSVLAKRHGVPLVMDGSLFNRSHWVGVSRLRDRPLETTVERKNPFPSRLVKKLSERHPRELFPVSTYSVACVMMLVRN